MAKVEPRSAISEVLAVEGERLDQLVDIWFPGDPGIDDREGRMKYVMRSGGKRLRPILSILAYRALGGSGDYIYPFALSWEILHNFSLVHDDLPIMDDDDYRRGRPTLHRLHGMNSAVFAGVDLLCFAYARVFGLVRDSDLPPRVGRAVLSVFTRGAGFEGMIGGQMMDLYWEGRKVDAGVVEEIHRLKTASMIEGAVEVGAVVGGATGGRLDSFRRFGLHLGLAYQIADDLLDRRADFQAMGKRTGRDSVLKKATFPSVFGEEVSERRLLEEIRRSEKALEEAGAGDSILRQVLDLVRERGMKR
jgi:geranylgeranyl diphosphate synthase type II